MSDTAVDYLLENDCINKPRDHHDIYSRFRHITLNSSQIFKSLVNIYYEMFMSHWHHLTAFINYFPAPRDTHPVLYMTRVYISTWFHDLYCSNREATRAISHRSFLERYSFETTHYSHEYDSFLCLLSNAIRPTRLKLIADDSLFIPVLCDFYNWTTGEHFNPFNIDDFVINDRLFFRLKTFMQSRKEWKMSKLLDNATGRPTWLFDWHDKDGVCAWFPHEQNYSMEDVAVAYIVGVAMTPNLGTRDVDDWIYPENQLFRAQPLLQLERLEPYSFYGSYMVRTIELDEQCKLPGAVVDALESLYSDGVKRRKVRKSITGTASAKGSSDEDVCRYRITDWCYYRRVIFKVDSGRRSVALTKVIFG